MSTRPAEGGRESRLHAWERRRLERDPHAALPLHPMAGNIWVPVWATRPGSYDALAKLARQMPVWLVLHTRNAEGFRPSLHTLDQLGATLGITDRTVSRHLKPLESAHLVFKVNRGLEPRTQRRRPPARWALDPFAAEIWRPEVEKMLAVIAEQDGQGGRWYNNAVTALDAFERRSRLLAARISEDMPVRLSPPRKRRKKSKKMRATRKNVSGSSNVRRGDVSTTGEVGGGTRDGQTHEGSAAGESQEEHLSGERQTNGRRVA